MAGERHALPRLSRLRCFEAAARHLSFTEAARELDITQAAVSQQVRILEQELGVPLFERLHRGLRLTPKGHRLMRSVSAAFGQIANAAEDVRTEEPAPSLKIGSTFAVATFWLLPRLARFRALHPDLEVHLIATDHGFDGIAGQVDAGIAFGEGVWAGFSSTLMCDSVAFPVCSPEYLRGRPTITKVEQLLGETLLLIEDDRMNRLDWPAWFAEFGIDAGRLPRAFQLNSHPLLVQAACEGQGIALGWRLLTDDLIAAGRLVRPLDIEVRTQKGFYFLEAAGRRSDAVVHFREWLMSTVGADAPSSPQPEGVTS